MSEKHRVFTGEFKEGVAQRIFSGESVSALHQQLQIRRSVLYRWREAYRKEGAPGLRRPVGHPPGVPNSPRPVAGPEAAGAYDIARVSRAVFYRRSEEHEPRQADVALRGLIQQIALENRLYGSRRVTAELEHRGMVVNRIRVSRLMRADNLLAVRKSA